MTTYSIHTICPGLACLLDNGERIATLERYDDYLSQWHGEGWFAYESPSHADAMANQNDRLTYAIAQGRTRRECANAFIIQHLN
ncbi:Uncharacterised protein [Actinomyces bovis]|uniref:Uncharacterized protein n=1 Tax=Actinomyces bovis TaxID=1658 RepID=A0ABY1VP86_9ACTO|nr:hypothetical protein [Actinomyces bovis]SPT53481.1 Uncharacterised protein [Actinomyces bovis]VEG55364.1 Uncharacterised protein [Actinomyces israelii]